MPIGANAYRYCRLITVTTLGHRLRSNGYSEAGARLMINRAHPSVTQIELHRPDGSVVLFRRENGVMTEVLA